MFKFEKYQRAILAHSNSDSVATLQNKFGKTLPGFVWFFLKKPAKKVEF